MSKPGFFLYTGDWLKDTSLLTLEAQGAWMRWLCLLHEHNGEVTLPIEVLGRYCGITDHDITRGILHQLEITRVAEIEWLDTAQKTNKQVLLVTKSNNALTKLSCRKMTDSIKKAETISKVRGEAGKKGMENRYNKTNKTNNLPSPSPSPSLLIKDKDTRLALPAQPDGFAEFWTLYPKKKSKGQAEKAWQSLNLTAELLIAILAGVRRGKVSRDWLKDSGKYIPHPATWIRAKGWEDQESISFSAPKPKLVVAEKKLTDEEIARSQEFLRDTINSLKGKMSMG